MSNGIEVARRLLETLDLTEFHCADMSDLQSKPWIVAKGVMFLGIAVTAATLLLLESPTTIRTAIFLGLLVWAACRFYYFLFYVLEHYVDPSYRYAGIIALVRALCAKRRGIRSDV